MTKKSTADYWRKREKRWQKEYEQNLEYWQMQIWTIYRNLKEDMQAEIDAWYSRFSKAEGISDAQAKQRISRADQDLCARRAKELVEMAQKDMRAGTDQDADKYFSDAANADMRIYNTTMKINRMQLLESMLDLEIDVAADKINRSMAEALEQQARKTYLNQSKILGDTVIGNMERIPALVNASFHGASFSDRIWGGHQRKLKDDMQRILARGLILGEHPDRFRKLIVSQTDLKTRSAYKAAGRLLNTEFARVQTSAQLDSIKTAGFEQFMFITASGCCPHCQANDGKTFDSKGSMADENLPPMHPNCRCTVAPYSDRKEYEEWLDGYSEHGMDWEEWQESRSAMMFTIDQAEQNYKSVELNMEHQSSFTTKFREERIAYPIENRKNWFVEEGVHVKPRQVHEIHKAVEAAMKVHGLYDLGKTRIVIVNDTTLSAGALAAYDPVQDVLKLGYYLTKKSAFERDPNDHSVMPHTLNVSMIHELFHWKDAKEYREKRGEITKETRNDYFSYRAKTAEKKIRSLAQKRDFRMISRYSQKSLDHKMWDEVYTEFRTFLLAGGRDEQIQK